MARVGLGALGVVTQLTLQCVPAHRLVEQTYVASSQVSSSLAAYVQACSEPAAGACIRHAVLQS